MRSKSLLARFKCLKKNDAGNVTMILSLAAVPLVAIAGLAVDMGRITEARMSVQQVADGAALAAAVTSGTDAQREAVGSAFIARNMPQLPSIHTTPVVNVAGGAAQVTIDTVVDGTLLAVAFPKSSSLTEADDAAPSGVSLPSVSFAISSSAAFEPAETTTLCLLALNASMANAIYIRGTGDFTAQDCTVHANSTNASALHLQGNADATADAFTVTGGWTQTGGAGSFSVTPEGGKPTVADPFEIDVSDPGGSASTVTVKKNNGNVSLSATKYANITIQAQGQATFTPGVHYITGTLSVGSQSTLNGTGVTLVLLGNNAKIDMGSGATIKLQAPTSGAYPGFAVIGNRAATTVQTNTVQGGAAGYIRGIWYTPKHKLYVTGNGDFNQSSAYFPIIADNIEIGGNGVFNAGFDWEQYGYPEPVELSAASQARLVN